MFSVTGSHISDSVPGNGYAKICKIESAKIHFYVLVFLVIFLQSNVGITSSFLNYIKIFYEGKHTKALIMKFTLL